MRSRIRLSELTAMIDTPDICLERAAAFRSQAEGPMLENVRRKLLTSAAAWDDLAQILLNRARELSATSARRSASRISTQALV